MKIYSWNVNGIRAVEKKGLFAEFLKNHEPDVLCIQETKAQETQVAEHFAEIYPQYEQYWHSAERKGYSSTAIFTKESPTGVHYGLPAPIVKRYALNDEYGDTSKEGRVLALEFEHFYILTVYTPNAKDDLSRIPMRQAWDPAFLSYMKQLAEHKPVVCNGDFNVAHTELDLARPKENKGKKGFTLEERVGFSAYLENGFVDTLRLLNPDVEGLYTWWSHWGEARVRNVGWRIDYTLISESLVPALANAKIYPDVLGSDHCPVSVTLNF